MATRIAWDSTVAVHATPNKARPFFRSWGFGTSVLVDEEANRSGRLLALDYGAARIGVAVSDELGLLAHPRPFVPAKPSERALRLIARTVKEEGVGSVVVGLPRNMDGSEGFSARRVRKFGAELEAVLSVPVRFVDERLTTVEARARLDAAGRSERQSKGRIDSASAAILLQSVLDAGQNRS